MPSIINECGLIPRMASPPYTSGAREVWFYWGGWSYVCTVGSLAGVHDFFRSENADPAHPLAATALSKYGVMLVQSIQVGRTSGGSLNAAFLSTVPGVLGSVHSIYSKAVPSFNNSNPNIQDFNSPRCLSGTTSTTGFTTGALTTSLGSLGFDGGNLIDIRKACQSPALERESDVEIIKCNYDKDNVYNSKGAPKVA